MKSENTLKIAFLGTPLFVVNVLETLNKNNFEIIGVITTPDKPAGRKRELKSSPIKQKALELGLKVLEPSNKKDLFSDFSSLGKIDLAIVASYGKIIPKEVLDLPKYGFLNIHPSLLPNLRGAIPVPISLIQGFIKTGVTIMVMGVGMDDGPLLISKETKIEINETSEDLLKRLFILGSELLIKVIPKYINKEITPIIQDNNKATYCYISDISKENGEIKWDEMITEHVHNLVRAYNPQPLAWTRINGRIINILKTRLIRENEETNLSNKLLARCKDFDIEILKLQPEGKKVMSSLEFINGYRNIIDKEKTFYIC